MSGDVLAQHMRRVEYRKRHADRGGVDYRKIGSHRRVRRTTLDSSGEVVLRCEQCETLVEDDDMGRDWLKNAPCNY